MKGPRTGPRRNQRRIGKRQPTQSSARGSRQGLKTARWPTKELARTWLITVMNPIIQGLRKEKVWLTRRNWSWRYSTSTFEHLWRTEYYVEPLYRDNLTALVKWYPQIERVIDLHDSSIRQLATACQQLFTRLAEAPDFAAAVAKADELAARASVNLNQARGAIPAEQWPHLLAEYAINNVQSLPDYYSTEAYWRVGGVVVLGVRNVPSLQPDFDRVNRAGEALFRATEKVESVLTDIRESYTRRFGLPPVPVGGEPEVSKG